MKPNENAFPNARILVVDDNPENVRLVERLLEWAGYAGVNVVTDSKLAEAEIRTRDQDIILLDLHMPKPDGFDILRTLREETIWGRSIPVLVFTADKTSEAKTKALEAGASDFLTKPGDAQEILMRVNNFLRLRQLHLELQESNKELTTRVIARTEELSKARREALETLARAAEFRDDETGKHTQRVGEFSAAIAQGLGCPEEFVEAIRLAAPLHDVGKIALPDSILLKPGRLEQDEMELMRRHTIVGGQVFNSFESPLMRLAKDIALHHHERWDGAGYPDGLSGLTIPLAARIVAVADVYDALVHARPYKPAWKHEEALDEISAQSGAQFDPEVVGVFLRLAEGRTLPLAA
ncbi:MAG TPA: HD domain-containing phosphohydrolase [Fimbriimonadaceae bacterium]|nr:HD domain-containing phosphohydrolase [Fimbriimonadaceae bacterium]